MIYSVNILRFFASFMVLLSHIAVKSSQYKTNSMDWYNIRGTGVDLFFIMSGFMMVYICSKKNLSPKNFLVNRAERLLPLYWLFTILALFVYLYNPSLINASGGKTDIISSFFILPTEYKYLVQNGWTLRYELYYSLIFACLLYVNVANNVRNIILIIILSAISFIGFFVRSDDYIIKYIFNEYMIEFSLGILAFYAFGRLTKFYAIGLVLLGFLMLIIQNSLGDFHTFFGRLVSKAFPMFLIFLGCINLEKYFVQVKDFIVSKILHKLAAASYSIFLSHPFTLSISARVCKKLGLLDSFEFFIILMVSALLVGLLVHKYIEKPLIKWVKSKSIMINK